MPVITVHAKEVRPVPYPTQKPSADYSPTAFLSWLRLAIYMAIVSIAIVISFHLNHQPTPLERKMALPLGLLFWFLALLCLVVGFSNYVKTVTRYGRRQALVQTGWKTQIVGTLSQILDPSGLNPVANWMNRSSASSLPPSSQHASC